ncbi:MAG TPA: hypothetical protein VGE45_08285 [Chloroflexia bacterium]|jgi:hypothetical protein
MAARRKPSPADRQQPEESPQEQKLKLSIAWQQPEGVPTSYVTNFAIQKDDPNYILSFYEIKTPVILGPDDYQLEAVKKLGHINAEYVARIIVTETRLREFIKVATSYLERETPPILVDTEG